MRTLVGRTPVVLARRWVALERLASLTLRRDAYAPAPGPTVTLSIGERTTYRAGAWLLDTFERAALGAAYPGWGATAGLQLVAGRVEPVAVGWPGMAIHTRPLPRDGWAAVGIAALAGAGRVGVLLRAAADTTDAYRITATPTDTLIERLEAGVATILATVPTPWRAGETLRVTYEWGHCRVYRDAIAVAEVHDAARLTDGHAGLALLRGDDAASAAITSFVAGPARQEYLGAGLDLGDVQIVLGQPVRFDVTLSNVAPMGGKDRFAALLRHGLNVGGTYDLDRGDARVLTVVQGATAPLTAAVGVIDAPSAVSEDRVRLECRGRDAFLTPKLAAGVVVYVPGPPPGGLTPLPPDPCAPAAPPVLIAGPVPPEPVEPPGAGDAAEGIGPEAPPAEDGGAVTYLAGAWLVTLDYHLEFGAGPLGEDIYVGSTTVQQYPLNPLTGPLTYAYCKREQQIGAGSAAYPEFVVEYLYYRGADIGATTLTKHGPAPDPPPSGSALAIMGKVTPNADAGLGYKVAFYIGTGIHSEADLANLRPQNPGEAHDPMPPRYMTLRSGTANVTYPPPTCTPHTPTIPDPSLWHQTIHPNTEIATIADIGLVALVGPQIVRMEIESAPVAASTRVAVHLVTAYLGETTPPYGSGTGPCGAGAHLVMSEAPMVATGPAGAA